MTLGNNDGFWGFSRPGGRIGIRNHILVVYTVECAHHVAREVCLPFRDAGVQCIGFSGCYPNSYAHQVMVNICTHPNVGGVLIVSLGCEGFKRGALETAIDDAGKPVATLVIQENNGTLASIARGREWVQDTLAQISQVQRIWVPMERLIIGAVCGGSDSTTGICGNPSVGSFFDLFVAGGGTAIFEETGEMIGLQDELARRGTTDAIAEGLRATIQKAERYYSQMGHGSFSPGNADGGLTTIEEKSLSSYSKSGSSPICGMLKPGMVPPSGGLYLLDVVPDGPPKYGYPNINDTTEIVELISCGCHLILFVTGRGSVVGSAVSPVVKITGNPRTYERMHEDMDVNAGKVLTGEASLPDMAHEISGMVCNIASGSSTKAEETFHQEFALGYKYFEPVGPSCHPGF